MFTKIKKLKKSGGEKSDAFSTSVIYYKKLDAFLGIGAICPDWESY